MPLQFLTLLSLELALRLFWVEPSRYGRQICTGLEYLHHSNVLHRDIKVFFDLGLILVNSQASFFRLYIALHAACSVPHLLPTGADGCWWTLVGAGGC